MSRPTLTRTRESGVRWHGTVGKNVSQLKHCQTHLSETGTKCPDFCLDLEENGLFCHLWFSKTALFTVIILIKSVPSTATLSKIACVFSEGSEKLPSGMVVAKKSKKSKKSKNQKIQKKIKKIQKNSKKFKKIIKKHGVRIFEYSPVSLGVYSGTSLHCCAQPYFKPNPFSHT